MDDTLLPAKNNTKNSYSFFVDKVAETFPNNNSQRQETWDSNQGTTKLSWYSSNIFGSIFQKRILGKHKKVLQSQLVDEVLNIKKLAEL
jgi:hypothetical protein